MKLKDLISDHNKESENLGDFLMEGKNGKKFNVKKYVKENLIKKSDKETNTDSGKGRKGRR